MVLTLQQCRIRESGSYWTRTTKWYAYLIILTLADNLHCSFDLKNFKHLRPTTPRGGEDFIGYFERFTQLMLRTNLMLDVNKRERRGIVSHLSGRKLMSLVIAHRVVSSIIQLRAVILRTIQTFSKQLTSIFDGSFIAKNGRYSADHN